MASLKQLLWEWPDGIVWKWTHGLTVGSRKKKYATFMRELKPTSMMTILDIGVSGAASGERAENYLEEWYPHPEMITAVGIDDLRTFKKRYPLVNVMQGDARHLPFADKSFDIVFSNAVIEHVGGKKEQQQFVNELTRVAKSAFITTPARGFPVESHSMIPVAHWFPKMIRNYLYVFLGRKNEAADGYLNLLSAKAFADLFPKNVPVRILRQRLFGWTSVLIALVKRV